MTILVNSSTFGQNIKKLRTARGLSQEETVARMQVLGSPISRSTYSIIEMGRGNIYITDLVALKQIFNVEFSEFFDGISTAR